MGAGEPGMLSPSPPTHGPLARAAELRWTSATRWVGPVPFFPFGTVGHPGDMRAGETRSDKAWSI